MRIKKYSNFVNEDLSNEIKISDDFSDLKKNLIEMVEKSLEKPSLEGLKKKLTDYISNTDGNPIEGLINDSDIYEFYLKWRNDIDSLLVKINFFEKNPAKNDVFGLYDYMVSGTKVAIKEVASKVIGDMSSQGQSESETEGQKSPENK